MTVVPEPTAAEPGQSLALLAIVSFALFMDYLIYGGVLPLMAFAPGSGLDEGQLGVLAVAYAVGVLGTTPLFGWLGERHGCRSLMIEGALLAGLSLVMFLLARGQTLLLVARLVQGAAAAASWIGGLSLIAERYPRQRVKMMGYALMGSTGGAVLGPMLGGFLHDAGGYALPLLVLLALTCAEAALCLIISPDTPAHPSKCRPTPVRARRPALAEVTALLLHPSVVVPALAVALAAAAWGILEPLLPVHLARLRETSAADIGVLFTAATIVYGLSAPFVSWLCDRVGMQPTIIAGMVGMAVSLPLLGVAGGFWSTLIVLSVVGIFFGLLLNPTSAELGDAVERRGMTCFPIVYAVYNIAYAAGMIATSSLAAGVAARIGFVNTLLAVGLVLLACVPAVRSAMRPAALA